MNILKFDDLPQGGFAGLREKQFVTDSRLFGLHKRPEASNGLGNFVYLADANFLPHGETRLHPHREIDVITVMVEGNIHHEGSMEQGQNLSPGTVQVQRAGGEGFTHNEINPDATENQMIQLWFLPDEAGQKAGYKVYQPAPGERAHVYGGPKNQSGTFDSKTRMDVLVAAPGQTIEQKGESMLYITKGQGQANGHPIEPRTLLRVNDLEFTALSDAQLILIYPAG
ncbi:MAG: redox-sensitive bicupin YhaK (pirin superfamily) [Glaciecola sp.]|jgi:redox-sensitive bicupin YhaK (pirin superfamily)